jgi:hypothetical protein
VRAAWAEVAASSAVPSLHRAAGGGAEGRTQHQRLRAAFQSGTSMRRWRKQGQLPLRKRCRTVERCRAGPRHRQQRQPAQPPDAPQGHAQRLLGGKPQGEAGADAPPHQRQVQALVGVAAQAVVLSSLLLAVVGGRADNGVLLQPAKGQDAITDHSPCVP